MLVTLCIFDAGRSIEFDLEFPIAPEIGDDIELDIEEVDQKAWPDIKVFARCHFFDSPDEPARLVVYADLLNDEGDTARDYTKNKPAARKREVLRRKPKYPDGRTQ